MIRPVQQVEYPSGDERTVLFGYVVAPPGEGPHPALIILRGVAGPDEGYIEIAQRVAAWGYVALLHGWKIRGDDPPDEVVLADLSGATSFLRSLPAVDSGRVGVLGFCRGGVHALMAARADAGLRAVVIFHGFAFRPEQARPGAEPFDLAQQVEAPMLVLHGTEDERAPVEGMRRLEESLARLGRPARFEYYPGARHGFAVRTHPGFHAASAEESFIEARRFIATLPL